MKMVLLPMKITKKGQKKFLCHNHINGVIIVDVYVAKYVLGLMERYFLNVHILMVEDDVQGVQEIVEEKIIDVVLILSKLRELK